MFYFALILKWQVHHAILINCFLIDSLQFIFQVKDLEVELETTKQNCTENMQQTVLTEKERFTQMQWDMEELRRKCMELELKLKSEEVCSPPLFTVIWVSLSHF